MKHNIALVITLAFVNSAPAFAQEVGISQAAPDEIAQAVAGWLSQNGRWATPVFETQNGQRGYILAVHQEQEPKEPASGGPPMLIDDTGTVDKGHWEVITAVIGDQSADGSDINPTLDVNYGAATNIQIHFLVPCLVSMPAHAAHQSGIGDAEVGMKYRFLGSPDEGLSLLVFPRLSFNLDKASANKGLVDRGVDLILPLQIQKVTGPFTVGGEAAYDFAPDGEHNTVYGAISGYRASDRVQIMAETLMTSSTDFQSTDVFFNAGSRVKLNEAMNLIFSAGHSLHRTNASGQYIFYLGLQTTL